MAYIDNLKDSWDQLGKKNAMWAVLSDKRDWNEKEFFGTGRKEIAQVLNVLKTHKVKFDYGKALDFGCGVGRLSQALGGHFKQVVGVDIAASMIKQAKELNSLKNVSYKHITSGNLKEFKDDSLDFVFTDIVFQHMRNELTLNYLKEMHRILKRQGVLVFQLPSQPETTWKGILIKLLPDLILTFLREGMEMHPIKKDRLLEYLKECGYEIITVERDKNHKHWQAYFYYVRKP